uniref:Uncharacterized protein n=1 Tax=Steinernema glaseri TaxID=37863 RepID=A0A1I8ASH6_9BILA
MHGREIQTDAGLGGLAVSTYQKALYNRRNHPADTAPEEQHEAAQPKQMIQQERQGEQGPEIKSRDKLQGEGC